MAELQYSTEIELDGPWLISVEQLRSLDETVDQQMSSLEQSMATHVTRRLDERMQQFVARYGPQKPEELENHSKRWRAEETPGYEMEREIRLSLEGGKRLTAKTFSEAASHPELAESRIVELKMRVGNRAAQASLSFGGWRQNLSLSVTGEDQRDREQLFIALRTWATDVQAPTWQRVWSRSVSSGFVISVVIMFVGLSLTAFGALSGASGPGSRYMKEAHALLDKGLSQGDISKALGITLALQSNYNPDPAQVPFWILWFDLAAVLIAVILWIRPSLEIGLGKGKRRMEYWKLWTRFVAVSLPTFIAVTVARSLLLRFLHLH